MVEKSCHSMILHLLAPRVKPAEIQGQTWASLSTTSHVKKHQSSEGRKGYDNDMVEQVQQALEDNPRRTMPGLAREVRVMRWTMQQIMGKELEHRSYARSRRHFISIGAKNHLLEHAKKIFNRLKRVDKRKTMIFSDEKFFTLVPSSNRHNDQMIWCKGELQDAPDDVCHVALHQREAEAMFQGIVVSDVKKGRATRVPNGIKVNAIAPGPAAAAGAPWIDANYTPGTWVCQQDGTTAHKARSTQKMLGEEGWDYWIKTEWPPSSPDTTPSDYGIWDHMASVACRDTAPNMVTLKECMNVAWENMDAKFIKKVTKRFRSRLEAMVAANSGRIK